MSEPRRLNTGDAHHIHRTGEPITPATPAAGTAQVPGQSAGRTISTAQAHGAGAAPVQAPYAVEQPYAPARPAAAYRPAQPAQTAAYQPVQDPYQPAQPAYPSAPPAYPQAQSAQPSYQQGQASYQPVQQSAYPTGSDAAPQAAGGYAPRRDDSAYAAARRSAQAAASANARSSGSYTRAAAPQSYSSTGGRQPHPAERQQIALRQAQSQQRGADHYAAYTTGGVERAEIEARMQARRQAEQAARTVQAAQEVPPAQDAQAQRAARMAQQVQQVMLAQEAREAEYAPAPPAAQASPRPVAGGRQIHRAAAESQPAPVRREQPAEELPAPEATHTARSAKGGDKAAKGSRGSDRPEKTGKSGSGSGGKPPRKGKGKSAGGSGGGKNGKGKKKLKWWQILLITLLAIALILGGAIFFILRALRPDMGALGLNSLINTPKEFQGDELNFLMIGIDRTEPDPNNPDDQNVGDGNTDMILWVHFNKNDNSMRMLQIPRDYMCTTDYSVSHNYRINNIAKTQGSGKDDAYQWNMAALCEQVHDMFQIPIDGYVSIHIEDLIEMVDVFGGVSMYIPQDIEYKGSYLPAGYQTLNGAAAEFLLRNRHGAGYENSDIDRLNMQRRFYAALFRRVKEMTVYDLFRHVPAFLNWMETDLSVSDLASFAVSVLKMPSDNIMICQMPVGTGGVMFYDQSVVYPARQADADLLNQYFRENTGPVDASQLQLVDQELEQNYGIYPSQLPVSDPNVQFMGDMMRADQEAQQNNNLDGSGVQYFEEDPPAGTDAAAGGDAADSDATDPAA